MEIIAVSGPAPEDTQSPEYLKWHEAEFNARGSLVIRQSSQIRALQAQVRDLEDQLTGVIDTARGLVKPPEPPKPIELVEDPYEGDLPDPLTDEERDAIDPPLPDPEPETDEEMPLLEPEYP